MTTAYDELRVALSYCGSVAPAAPSSSAAPAKAAPAPKAAPAAKAAADDDFDDVREVPFPLLSILSPIFTRTLPSSLSFFFV